MKILIILVLALLNPVAQAQTQIAFMHEVHSHKHIGILDPSTGKYRMVTKGEAAHLYPDLSADGSQLAYVQSDNLKDFHLLTQEMATGKIHQWTEKPGFYLHASFSGDQKKLAFSGPHPETGVSSIGVIELKSPHPKFQKGERTIHQVTPLRVPSEHPAYFPSLSSAGRWVVFQQSHSSKEKKLYRYHFESQKLELLPTPFEKAMAPELSADDRYVTYTGFKDGEWNIAVFDLKTKKTEAVTQDPFRNHAPAFTPDGKIVFASERNGNFKLYEASRWNTPQRKIRPLLELKGDLYAPSVSGDLRYGLMQNPPLPKPARSSFGAIQQGNRIYIAGGHQGKEHTYPPESFLREVHYFDLKTKKWHQTTPRKIAAHGYGLAAWGKYIYAFGGFTYSDRHLPKWKSIDLIERYDTETEQWHLIGKLPRNRSSNVVAQVGSKVYLLGGWDSTPKYPKDYEGKFHREIDVFDLKTEKVSVSSSKLPDPLRRALTGGVKDDKILLIGGLGQGASHFELLDQVTEFDPKTGQWRELPRLPFPTFAPAAGTLNGALFLFGGMFKTGPLEYIYVNHIFEGSEHHPWKHTGRYLKETKGFGIPVPLDQNQLAILGGHSYEGDGDAPVRTFEIFSMSHGPSPK